MLGGHPGVAAGFSAAAGGGAGAIFCEALALDFAGGFDAGADGFGGFAGDVAGDVAVLDGGDFDVDVDAVKEGAGDAVAVALDVVRRAAAFALGVAEVAAFARMRCLFAR